MPLGGLRIAGGYLGGGATTPARMPVAPMFHARAHMVGSGKSYLCELITAFATPQRGTPTAFPADDKECRKLLLADLRATRAPQAVLGVAAGAVGEADGAGGGQHAMTPAKSEKSALAGRR
jgi:hypothetical protein